MALQRASECKTYTPREVRVRLVEVEMTGQDFASYVGISAGHFSDWLHGRRGMSQAARARLSDVMEALEEEVKQDQGS